MITEIFIDVSFLKRTLKKRDTSVGVIQGDYNTTKMVFNIEEDVSQYSVRLEMSNPSGELIFAKNLTNNEVILGGEDEEGNPCSIFNAEGLHPYELVLYNETSQLTSATGWLNVVKQAVNIGNGKCVEYYTPLFEDALKHLELVDNLDITATKEGEVTTISVTNLQGKTQTVTVKDGKDYVLTKEDKEEISNLTNSGAKEYAERAEEAQEVAENSAREANQAEENTKNYEETAKASAELAQNEAKKIEETSKNVDAHDKFLNDSMIDDIPQDISHAYQDEIIIDGIQINADNTLKFTGSTGYMYAKYSVQAGDEYSLSTLSSGMPKYPNYCFVLDDDGKDDGKIVLTGLSSTSVKETIYDAITIPENGKFMYVLSSKIVLASGKIDWRTKVIRNKRINNFESAVTNIITQDNSTENNVIAIGRQLLDDKRPTILNYNRNKKLLNFAWITDCHMNGVGERIPSKETNSLTLFSILCKEKFLDFGVSGGDIYSTNLSSFKDTTSAMENIMQMLGDIPIPLYFIKGNHDFNAKCKFIADLNNLDWENTIYYVVNSEKNYEEVTESNWDGVSKLYYGDDMSQRITRSQWAMMFQNNIDVVFNPNDPTGGYFYKDFENEKIRIIVTNCFDNKDDEAYLESVTWHREQTRFIAEEALNFTNKTNKSEWGVILLSHHMYHDDLNGASAIRWELYPILEAFQKGKNYSGANIGGIAINVDFSKRGAGNLICTLHGHNHADNYDNDNGWNNIGTDAGYGGKYKNCANEFCFSVFTVDTENKILYETRIGRGNDRKYSYGDESALIE